MKTKKKKSSSGNRASNLLRNLRKLAPKNSFCYVRPMEKEAELLVALLQSSVRGCFMGWKALKERCVLSDGESFEGDKKTMQFISNAIFRRVRKIAKRHC